MVTYTHHAKYYETDQMGVIHHSNYIRWMEEARIALMDQIGCSYRRMEEAGIVIPVLEVRCEYRSMVRFDDLVEIRVWIQEYNGIRLKLGYEMREESTGKVCTVGMSGHCFLDGRHRPVSLKRSHPEWDHIFRKCQERGGSLAGEGKEGDSHVS